MRKVILFVTGVLMILVNLSCEKSLLIGKPAEDKLASFEDMWKVMNERYALFTIKKADWDSIYRAVRPQVTAQMSDDNFFRVMSQALEPLEDGHVSLLSPNDTFTNESFYKKYLKNFNLQIVKERYLNTQYDSSGPVIYKVVSGIGYLHYSSFKNGLTDAALSAMMQNFATTRGLIIDIRGNTGGSVKHAEALLSHLVQTKTLIRYELRKTGPGRSDFSEKIAVFVNPAGFIYTKPVILLTNRSCFSAANDFASAMSSFANVTLVGDQTGGGGSFPANYLLVNGWKLQYSATMTLSSAGLPIENGIVPDIPISMTNIDESNGRDPILEKAYQLLQ